MNPQVKTQTILGYELTLVAGHRYRASRPMLDGEISDDVTVKLPVTIVDYENQQGDPVAYVGDLPYDEANEFLNAFNNGKMSFDGRVW
jgi:hypothetical protein